MASHRGGTVPVRLDAGLHGRLAALAEARGVTLFMVLQAGLAALLTIGSGRRRVAVLGYLAELGDQEREGHAEVGRVAAELGVDRLVVVGAAAAPIHDGAVAVQSWGGESVVVSDQDAAVAWLRACLRPGDVVLVKGSKGSRVSRVVDAIRAIGQGPAPARP